jgi:hypothetical protein
MATGQPNTRDLEYWVETARQLKKLNCSFAAFYGAEPLFDDIDKLSRTIQYFESIGIATTVITSGFVSSLTSKLDVLWSRNLRSLSMSYDILPLCDSSKIKTSKALETLQYFQSLGKYRDVAAIATLTRKNFRALPESIKTLSKMNIWTFFDMIHSNRNQPGSKVKDSEITRELLFAPEDFNDLAEVLREVLALKREGMLCHVSELFIDKVMANDFEVLRKYNWHCCDHLSFPAWVSIDCDGTVSCCDDYKSDKIKIYSNRIAEDFQLFSKLYRESARAECSGCLWNTHYDAHMIKEGRYGIGNYIHGERE